ncbi:MAG: hypothetical protein Q8P89_00925 [bacterium]|nr:hypothetical protein [bacterium]
MVGREINLLPETAFAKKTEEKRRQKSVFGITFVIVILSSVFIFGAFTYSLYLRNQDAAIEKKTQLEIKKISSQSEKVILLGWIKSNLSAAQQVLTSRPIYETQLKSLDFVTGLATTSASLVDYSSSGKAADFTVIAADSTATEDFISRLLDENKTEPVLRSVKIKSVVLQKEGQYKISFTVTLTN